MGKHKYDKAIQSAALPWRLSEGGTREVMLLTSRETGRWVIPKGWPMKGRKPAEVASQEAYEEAGLIGHIVNMSIQSRTAASSLSVFGEKLSNSRSLAS